MKKIIILRHGGGELANQLWNYLSIYAYGLEIKTTVRNPSFFEYHSFFNFLIRENISTKMFSFFFQKPRRRSDIINRMGRMKYLVYAKTLEFVHNSYKISSENNDNKVLYLPPTEILSKKIPPNKNLYLVGWLFRNPRGLEKFSQELHSAFTPHKKVLSRVLTIIEPLRKKYTHVIGVHIRQSDYKTFKNGKFLIDQIRVAQIMREYTETRSYDKTQTLFLITSDGVINQDLFSDFSIFISRENSIIDLFLLSKTDIILGSNSSFGAFASWYGNIPHIVMSNDSIDWNYYHDKKTFFENKYLTLAHF